jgi:hypothetical protein
MARIIQAAVLAAIVSTSGLSPAQAEPVRHLIIAPGQSIQDAILLSRINASNRTLKHHAQTPDAASEDPTISAGAVVKGTLVVGQATSIPALKFTYQAATNGLNSVSFTFTSPNGADSLSYTYNPRAYAKGGTVVFTPDSHAPFYTQPGKWMLTSAIIVDNQYNYTQYTQAQLAAMFTAPYVTVVNSGPVDITPPVVTAGEILTPKVSLSSVLPIFRASLTGTDDVSGIAFGLVIITAPGSSFGQVDLVPAPYVKTAETVISYAPFYPGQPAGTWSITGYEICDIAQNCLTDTSATDIQNLFGTTTFTVTK